MSAQLGSRRATMPSPRSAASYAPAPATMPSTSNNTTDKHRVPPLQVQSINHMSRVCKDVTKSASFYRDVLGFVEVKRPTCFNFRGAWLFNYNIGIHLIEGEPVPKPSVINIKSEHWSFTVTGSLEEVEQRLQGNGVVYKTDTLVDGPYRISQIFFHDPDNNMIEICNCECFPLVPVHQPALENDVVAFRSKHSATADNNRPPRLAMPISQHTQTPGGLMGDGLGHQ